MSCNFCNYTKKKAIISELSYSLSKNHKCKEHLLKSAKK